MGGPIPLVCGAAPAFALDTIPTTAPADLFGDDGRGDGDPDDRSVPTGTSGRSGWRRLVRDSGTASAVGGAGGEAIRSCSSRSASANSVMGRGSRPRRARSRRPSSCAWRCRRRAADGPSCRRGNHRRIRRPRPSTEAEAAEQRARRDAEVLRHAPVGVEVDLRSPGQVKSLLSRIGVECPTPVPGGCGRFATRTR